MHQIHRTNRRGPMTAVVALLLASLLLAACGSSSSTTASTAAASTTAGAGGAGGRFAGVRECLQKAGITLPQRKAPTPGTGGPPAGGFGLGGGGGAGPTLPSGVTREQFQKALRKCGGGLRRGGFGNRLSSPTYLKALASFAACMTQNGVKLPAPNTSGKGPVFNTTGLNINSPAFLAARTKCSSLLRVSPGATGPGGAGPGGAPPGA